MDHTERFIIANITWNNSGWRNIYVDPRAGHSYPREQPGHESLNFEFNKRRLDTTDKVFGYVQWRGPPTIGRDGVIFFYTKNLISGRNEIVGVYGNALVLKEMRRTTWKGFEDDELLSNICADKNLSLLFSIPLELPFRGFRAFKYINGKLAETIVSDEIEQLKKSGGMGRDEYQKLTGLFEFITRRKFESSKILAAEEDAKEQQGLEEQLVKEVASDPDRKMKIAKELMSITPHDPERIEYAGKTYERDNKTVAQLKVLRDFKCQLCGENIRKKNGEFYVEAAHVNPKREKGPDTPNNIIILCPNHHKEFDLGDRKILEHTQSKLTFEVNGTRYDVDLSLDKF